MARKTLSLFSILLLSTFIGCGGRTAVTPAPITPKNVVFVGDSITFLWAQNVDFPSHHWTSQGVSGVTSDYALAHFQDAIDLKPDVIHILIGTNDVYPGWNLDGTGTQPFTASNIQEMVNRARLNGITPIICTIPPWGQGFLAEGADTTPERYDRINQLNNWIRFLAATEHITIVEYHDALVDSDGIHYVPVDTFDGVHPDAQGFTVMMPLVEKAIALSN